MVAQMNEPHPDEITRALVIERVQAKLADGIDHGAAFAAVWEEIEREGQTETLARLFGVKLVADLWRAWNITHRPAAVARTISRPVAPSLVAARTGEVIPVPPQPRRIDLTLVRETLDAEYKVNGTWKRLGDMTSGDCLVVAEMYRAAAIADEHKARHMRAIAAKLEDGQTVEQVLSEQQVLRLYRISAPPGNTLA